MSFVKKRYVAPQYEVVKFDDQILTGRFQSGCSGIVAKTLGDAPNTCTDPSPEVVEDSIKYWY